MRKALFAAAVLAPFLVSGPVFAASARIVAADGDVTLQASPSAEPRPARAGDAVAPGEWITTGPASFCEVALGEASKSGVRLRAGTSARISSATPARIELQNGKLLALVRGLSTGSTFEVATPAAVAAVRGTTFTASPDAFEAIEDSITVTPADGGDGTLLDEGKSATFGDGGLTIGDVPPGTLDAARDEAKDMESRLGASGDGDVLGGSGPDVPETDVLSDTLTSSSELGKELDRLDDEKKEEERGGGTQGGGGGSLGGGGN